MPSVCWARAPFSPPGKNHWASSARCRPRLPPFTSAGVWARGSISSVWGAGPSGRCPARLRGVMNDEVAAPRSPAAALFVFCLLLAVYGLSFSGQFTSDDEHILAAGAVTLARTGRLGFAPAFGNTRLLALTELPHFTPVEPLHPF